LITAIFLCWRPAAGYDALVLCLFALLEAIMLSMFLCSALVGLLPALDGSSEAASKELARLQGEWTMAALEVNGDKVPPEKFQASRLEIKEDRYIVHTGRSTHEAKIKIDPAKTPKTMDMTFQDGDNKGDTAEGIYKLDGDTLTICRPRLPPHERPTEFVTKPGSDRFIVTWKRAK
jgi:uncharacterized protein (TIGR03067 family)